MPSPLNINNITPPRVPLTDPRTGMISREWYRFFLNMFQLVGDGSNPISLTDVQKGPPSIPIEVLQIDPNAPTNAPTDSPLLSQLAEIDKQLNALESQPECPCEEYNAETQLRLDGFEAAPPNPAVDLNAEVQKSLQALQMVPQPELGTMAALQQANVPWMTFDTTPQSVPEATTGTLYWDSADRSKTLALVMEDTGAIIQDIGEETFYRVKASATITKGQVLMFTGTVGASGGLIAAPATGLTATQSEYVLGIATQDIALNAWGYATWFGEIKGVNTTGGVEAWVDGQVLYYNPSVAGGLTKNIPTAPNPKVIVASVVHAASNGILFVRPTFGSALGETDSNVQITSLTNGDLLQYIGANSRWENKSVASVIAGASGAPVTKTANFSVAAGETWLINNKSGSSCTVTLPTAATNIGRVLYFLNYQAQTLVSASSNVVPLAGGAATTAILEAVAGANATLVCDGTNWIMTQYDSNNALQLE